MPRYFYRAKNLKGEEETGTLEAQSSSHLSRMLKEKGYFLIEADEEGAAKSSEAGSKKSFFSKRADFFENLFGVSLVEKLFFTRNLGVLVRSGVPLPRAFDILSNQAKTKKFKKVLKEISSRIVKGENLSTVLSFYPDIFPEIFQETLRVGEETGKMEDSLDILSSQLAREHTLKSTIKTAMVYPVVVLTIAVLIGILMFVFAIPKLKAAFAELKIELPFTTRLLLSFSDFLINKWPLAILILFFLVSAVFFALKRKKGGKIFSKITLKIPLVSKLVRDINSALALRTLSSLFKAGVPIVRTLEVASGSLGNFYFKKSFKEAAVVVEKGKKLSEALLPYEKLYSPMVLEMMKVGEETGETSNVLEQLAVFYEKEVTSRLEKLSSVIEPFLILVIGGIVGFFAVSMMQPMFSIMKGF